MIIEMGENDLDLLAHLGDKFYSAAGLAGHFKAGIFITHWQGFISNEIGKIFALTENDKIVGALGAIKYTDFNSGLLVAGELFWFIDPESRGKGLSLLGRYVEWAKGEGCKRISMAYLENIMPEKLKKVYERYGFKPAEVAYTMEVP